MRLTSPTGALNRESTVTCVYTSKSLLISFSTLARTFSDHLDNAFSISGGLEDLSASIDKK